jgi:hypothetical protein
LLDLAIDRLRWTSSAESINSQALILGKVETVKRLFTN